MKNNFKTYYDNLPASQRDNFRQMVCNTCGFSIATFYYRLNGENDLFTDLEKKAIAIDQQKTVSEIFGNPIAA